MFKFSKAILGSFLLACSVPSAQALTKSYVQTVDARIPTIGNAGVTVSTLNVPDSGNICGITLRVDISHSRTEDLDIKLGSPQNERWAVVVQDDCGTSNDLKATFDDAAPTSLQANPFQCLNDNAHVRPDQSLTGTFSGYPAMGDWTLHIRDDQGGRWIANTGNLNEWELIIEYGDCVALEPGRLVDVPITFTQSSGDSISALGVVTSTLNINLDRTICDVDLRVDISHTKTADLDVRLIGPDDRRWAVLVEDDCGRTDDLRATFDDSASTSLQATTSLCNDDYAVVKPDDLLSMFNGYSAAGTWKLEVVDDGINLDVGTLNSWDLIISPCVVLPPISRNGGAMDDPHFKTWAGKWYDFMGACDLVLLHAPNFSPTVALDINIRTKIRYEYSYIESAVVKIGKEMLEVASYGDYYLNGIGGVDASDMTISGFSINHTHPNDKTHIFEIAITAEESIVVKTFKDMVSVKLDNADTTRFHGSHGMMGDFDTPGKMLGRDGATVVEDPNAFAAEWQVRDDEPMLFQRVSGPQYPQKCILPSLKRESRRLGESIARTTAEKACAGWPADTKDNCIHDVMATGDVELAEAGAF